MRFFFSVVLTFAGLVSVYLFACEALTGLELTAAGLKELVSRIVRPLTRAGPLATLTLVCGMAAFAAGLLLASGAELWIALPKGEQTSEAQSKALRSSRETSRQNFLELALAFNALVVGAILVLLDMSMSQPSPHRVLGALFIAGTAEALIGTGIAIYLLLKHRRSGRRRTPRPLLAASASINILEVLFLLTVIVIGCSNGN